jgi:hypothetical protein
VAEAIGTKATLLAAGTISLSATLAVLLVRDVRTLRRRSPVELREPVVEPAT